LKSIIQAIKVRSAPLHFGHIKKNELHRHFTAAKKLSEVALTLSRPAQPRSQELRPMQPFTTQPLDMEKVTADIPDDSGVSTAPSKRPDFPAGHRGRLRLYEMRERNRKLIMEASSAAEFWKYIKRFIDPAPNPISVTADSLKDVFERRLNPPTTLPQSFDAFQHKINRLLAGSIPSTTPDPTPEQFFSKNGQRTTWNG
jgi:hypothetical protein